MTCSQFKEFGTPVLKNNTSTTPGNIMVLFPVVAHAFWAIVLPYIPTSRHVLSRLLYLLRMAALHHKNGH